jgi:hypothetical protein
MSSQQLYTGVWRYFLVEEKHGSCKLKSRRNVITNTESSPKILLYEVISALLSFIHLLEFGNRFII